MNQPGVSVSGVLGNHHCSVSAGPPPSAVWMAPSITGRCWASELSFLGHEGWFLPKCSSHTPPRSFSALSPPDPPKSMRGVGSSPKPGPRRLPDLSPSPTELKSTYRSPLADRHTPEAQLEAHHEDEIREPGGGGGQLQGVRVAPGRLRVPRQARGLGFRAGTRPGGYTHRRPVVLFGVSERKKQKRIKSPLAARGGNAGEDWLPYIELEFCGSMQRGKTETSPLP